MNYSLTLPEKREVVKVIEQCPKDASLYNFADICEGVPPQSGFCGISPSTFYRWRRQVQFADDSAAIDFMISATPRGALQARECGFLS